LGLAAACGISVLEFWRVTPLELFIYAEAAGEVKAAEREHAYNISVATAYFTSRWVWAKRVNVKKYLHGAKSDKKPMTDAEMLQKIAAIHAEMEGRKNG